MSDREAVSRVAKILARAGSDNQNEATAALEGAYKRMVRDGVTVRDLLTLPLTELYQTTLVKLIDVILADQPNLSPVGRREAYAEYMRLIVEKFSGKGTTTNASGSRTDEADDYNTRNGYSGAGRSQTSSPDESGTNTHESKNSQTQKSNRVFTWTIGDRTFSFSPADFWRSIHPFFERGSLFSHVLHDPLHGLRLFSASLLWGVAFSLVLLTVAALAHVITNTGPLYDVKFKNAFSFLTAIGMIWKARVFFMTGWFRG